jgi:hypothetical protein
VEEQSSSPHGSQKAEKERDHGQNTPLKAHPGDLLPPTWPHL